MPSYPERVSPSCPNSTEAVNEASDSLEELLEQIEVAEAELEEQKEMKLKFEQDEDEGFDHADDLKKVQISIRSIQQKLKDLCDRLEVAKRQEEIREELVSAYRDMDFLNKLEIRLKD